MTNAERYLKDGVSVEEFTNEMSSNFGIATPRSESDYDVILYLTDVKKWLKAKVKPTLTEHEKVILRNIDETVFTHIGREPKTSIYDLYLRGKRTRCVEIDDILKPDLFTFIKERRRIQNRGVVRMKLSRKEKIILSNIITNNYKYIHRDGSGSLWITEDVWLKPKKDPTLNIPYRESDDIFWFGMYRHLFVCIGRRRRIQDKGVIK